MTLPRRTPAARVSASKDSFKGNKASLPTRPCAVCGRAMTWRKRWARHWDEVKTCSAACRRRRAAAPDASG